MWIVYFGGTSGKEMKYYHCSVQRAQTWPKTTGVKVAKFAQMNSRRHGTHWLAAQAEEKLVLFNQQDLCTLNHDKKT